MNDDFLLEKKIKKQLQVKKNLIQQFQKSMKYFMLITVQSDNEIVLESKWTLIFNVAIMNSTVCVLLVKYISSDEVVRVISKSTRYMKTNELSETVLFVLESDEKFLLLDSFSICYIHYCLTQWKHQIISQISSKYQNYIWFQSRHDFDFNW